MKHFLLLSCVLLYSFHSFSQAPNKLLITPLTGDYYVFTTYNTYNDTPFPANGLYLVTEEGVALFDSPWDTTQFQPLLDSIKIKHNKPVVLCIATHAHEDRTAGLEYYKHMGIKTYTTKQTDEISKVNHEKRAEFLMTKDTSFSLGQYSFQTYYPGEGHTPDNIVIWFPEDKIIYGGCFIKSTEASSLGNLADANIKAWPTSIQKVQRKFKNPRYIIPGHQSWQSLNSLEHTLKLLREKQ